MKCSSYSGNDGRCYLDALCPNSTPDDCRHGWIPFWTPSERAGLKAMGEEYLYTKSQPWMGEERQDGIIDAIDAYVSASRKVKEGK